MLKRLFLFAALLIGFAAPASAQWVQSPDTWVNDLLRSPSVLRPDIVHQARVFRGVASAQPPAGVDNGFNGNPFAIISSISGAMTSSRDDDLTHCYEPCFIQVSSKGTTAGGTSRPYEDLACSYNFGDASGTETFTRPTDGATVNANSDQTQCEAAYVYRTPGTYNITLTLKGSTGTCNSSGRCAVIQSTVQKQVVVLAFVASAEYYYDSNASCPCTGTQAQPFNSASDFATGNTLLNSGNNIALNVKRNSDFTIVQGWELWPAADRARIRIKAYGTGTDPILRTDGSSTRLHLSLGGGNGSGGPINVSDIVVSGFKLLNQGFAGGIVSIGNRRNSEAAGGNTTHVYLDNVWMEATTSAATGVLAAGGAGGGLDTSLLEEGNKFGCWKCTIKNPTTTSAAAIGHVGSAAMWDFTVGNYFEGAGTSRLFDHHFYPDTRENFLVLWTTFGPTGTGTLTRSFGVNGNWDGRTWDYTDHQIAGYYVIAENTFTGTLQGGTDHTIDLGNRTNNTFIVSLTGSISGTTLNVTSVSSGIVSPPTSSRLSGTVLINTEAGGTLINETKVIGSSTVNSGLCSPACTGNGGTGTYAVDTSQTVASQAMYGADSTVRFQNVVIAANLEKGFENTSMLWGVGQYVTIRDGKVMQGTGEWFRPAIDQIPLYTLYTTANYSIYRMKIWMGSGANSCIICFNTGKTWTVPSTVGYNVIADARTSPKFEEFIWADFLSSGAKWDFNTWSAPNGSNPWYDGATAKTFANWQAAGASPTRWGANDTNLGTSVPPGWSNPPTTWAQMP